LQKAERFKFREDQWRSIAARGVLRILLSRHLEEIEFDVTEYGKPFLKGDCGIQFNVAHSGGFVIIALAKDREVGVDIERMRPGIEVESIAGRFFFHQEYDWLLGQADRTECFYRLWTAKESVLKAVGLGLSMPLDSFSVAFAGDGEVKVSSVMPLRAREIEVGAGYKAAVTVRGDADFRVLTDTAL
jgi:4'-phosphopantetheinyl transferase